MVFIPETMVGSPKIHEDFNIRPEFLSMASPINVLRIGKDRNNCQFSTPPIHRAISSKPFSRACNPEEERKTGNAPAVKLIEMSSTDLRPECSRNCARVNRMRRYNCRVAAATDSIYIYIYIPTFLLSRTLQTLFFSSIKIILVTF